MDSIQKFTESDMINSTEEIFLDFRGEENKEIGKLVIIVKDRRKYYPLMEARLKNVDNSKGKLNVLNLFIDTVS